MSRYQRDKPFWILLTPHHSSFVRAGCSSCHPTNSIKALKTLHFSHIAHSKSAYVYKCLVIFFLQLPVVVDDVAAACVRVPTHLENSWNFVNLENSWKTRGILCQTWNFWHDKSIYASFDILTAVLLSCYKGMNGEHQRMSNKYFIS